MTPLNGIPTLRIAKNSPAARTTTTTNAPTTKITKGDVDGGMTPSAFTTSHSRAAIPLILNAPRITANTATRRKNLNRPPRQCSGGPTGGQGSFVGHHGGRHREKGVVRMINRQICSLHRRPLAHTVDLVDPTQACAVCSGCGCQWHGRTTPPRFRELRRGAVHG